MFRVAMISDVVNSIFKRPVTQRYPEIRVAPPERYRGRLIWNPEACTGCGLCVKDCPSDAIEFLVNDKKAKAFVFRYSADRCTFCAQCVKNCRQNSIVLDPAQWEMASLNKSSFETIFGKEDVIAAWKKAQQAEAPEASAG